ncbi:hypothetical protein [Brachyspira alvinipulli]|uniref:hypothetical protein n=1 Tax=Brachyspira alvinipulli TaxID=84379 RepID=UPI00048145A2|nr:hypothetical protein [Brachyspira alvinipulli]
MNHPITIYVSDLYKNIKKQEKYLQYFSFIINRLIRMYTKRLIKLYSTLRMDLEICIAKFTCISKILQGFYSSNKSKETLNFIKTHIKLHNTFNELSNDKYQMIINNLNNKYRKFIIRYYILENDNSKNINISGSFKMTDILLIKKKKLNSFIKYKIGKSY